MKIKDICTSVTDGSHNPPQGIEKSQYMMLSSKNIFDDEITFDEPRFLSEKDFEREHKRTKIAVGDVLLTIVGTVGRTAVVDEDMPAFALQRSVAVLHPKNDVCLPRFLMYALRGKRTYIANRAKGVAQKGIYLKEVSDIDIYIPDISNQEIIINKLDKVNAIIKLRQEELLALDNLIKARFVEMFGTLDNPSQEFAKATLKELCNKITDGKHGGCKAEEGTERYFVGAREIYDDEVHYNTAPEINIDEFEKDYKRCNIEIGDFLIVNTGATIGKSAIATDERTEHTLLQKSVALLKVKKEVLNPVFLKWCYRVNTQMYIVKSASAQPNLLLSKINATVIYVPNIELQNQFVSFVEQVDKSKVAVQKALDEAQMLFDSLMQEYFG